MKAIRFLFQSAGLSVDCLARNTIQLLAVAVAAAVENELAVVMFVAFLCIE